MFLYTGTAYLHAATGKEEHLCIICLLYTSRFVQIRVLTDSVNTALFALVMQLLGGFGQDVLDKRPLDSCLLYTSPFVLFRVITPFFLCTTKIEYTMKEEIITYLSGPRNLSLIHI